MVCMIAGLELSPLVCKCVFYRLEYNAKEGPHGIKLWRSSNAEVELPADRARKADEKNGTFCLVIIFNPRDMVIKMSRVAHFWIFCWW